VVILASGLEEEERRAKLRPWLASALEQYAVTAVGLEEAMAIVEALSVLEEA